MNEKKRSSIEKTYHIATARNAEKSTIRIQVNLSSSVLIVGRRWLNHRKVRNDEWEKRSILMKYEIYQIKNCKGCNYVFRSWETARNDFKFSDYIKVYYGCCKDDNAHNTLEDLFEIFNLKRPLNFKGHSLSVSDIVCVDSKTYFYCDSFGWVDITKYVYNYYVDAMDKVISKSKDSQGFSQGDKKNGYI